MKFDIARATGRPFRWQNWPRWYTFDQATGTLKSTCGTETVSVIPVHMMTGDLWELKPQVQELVDWFRPRVIWRPSKSNYFQCDDFFKSKASAESYFTGCKIIHWEVARLPENYEHYIRSGGKPL